MTTKKMAVFVEGQTELIFMERLISEIAGAHNVFFQKQKLSKQKLINLTQTVIDGEERKYFVLIYNCENDEKVKSKILESRNSLEASGFDRIIGLRDLYPIALADLHKVKQRLAYGLPGNGVPTHMLISVAEVEAWFLQDLNHYKKISEALDPAGFKVSFGFDPATESAEKIPHPSQLLKEIYQSAGRSYLKKLFYAQRTVNALDMDGLCLINDALLPHFKELKDQIEDFVS